VRSLQAENALLARELGRVQQRCTRWRADSDARIDALQRDLMRARADGLAKTTRIAALAEALAALQRRAATWLTNEQLARRLADLQAHNRCLERELAQSAIPRVDAGPANLVAAVPPCPSIARMPPVSSDSRRTPDDGPRILCIGVRPRQMLACRQMVEDCGGRLAALDDGLAHEPLELRQALAAADAVILQAGFVRAAVCQAVERHCRETGAPCVRPESPCARAFERSLAQALALLRR